MKTQEQKLLEVEERKGFIAGATPKKKSGKFIVRLPVTLHAALEAEAKDEGVSLNQLVVAKLAISLSKLTAR
jgi:predicted HicB family RNase H-like nuclease